MKYIKNRFLILESKNLKNEIVSDICIAMSLINPDFLSPLLDKGLVNRYTQNSTAFLSDLKTLLFKNDKLKIGKKDNGKIIIDNDMGVANKIFNMNEFDIQSDWNVIINSRTLARNIYDKLLLDDKLTPELIKYVYWLKPNQERDELKQDITIELEDGRQFNIILNKSFSLSGSLSYNTVANILLGDNSNKLYSDIYQPKWSKLIQEWVRLSYENANSTFRSHIEKFVSLDRIGSITYNNYYEIINKDDSKKILGEEVHELNKNYTHLYKLLADMYSSKMGYENFEDFNKNWLEIKKIALNSNIIEDLFYNEFEILDAEEKEKSDEKIKAKGKLKLNFVKLFADILKADKYNNQLFFSKTSHYNIPNRTHIRDNYDKYDILYQIHHKVSDTNEEALKNDFEISFDVYYNSEVVCSVKMYIGYTKEMDKISTKYKLNLSSDFNYKINI